MLDISLPPMAKTAAFMRHMGYSERSIAEITGLSRHELVLATVSPGPGRACRSDQAQRATGARVRPGLRSLQG